jgi:hypothetical protein
MDTESRRLGRDARMSQVAMEVRLRATGRMLHGAALPVSFTQLICNQK